MILLQDHGENVKNYFELIFFTCFFAVSASVKVLATPAGSPQHVPVRHRVTENELRSKSGSPVWQLSATSPAADSNLSSLMDFPPLSTRPSRAEERRIRDGQEGSSLVFREAHHAQLREVHGANVRATEALVVASEKKESVDRYKKRPSLDDLNSLVEDAIRDISTEGEHVTVERVCVFINLVWNHVFHL